MKLVKRKKPSHDIFNKIYMEEILDAYERLVKRLSWSRIYFEILPKQYQREYYKYPFGKAFNETSGETFSEVFSSAFQNKFETIYFHFDPKKYKLHEAFKIMCHYDLVDSLTEELHEKKEYQHTKTLMENMMKPTMNKIDEINIGRTILMNDARSYHSSLEFLHLLYTMNKYKILSENASSDMRVTFRERNLAAKNRYIDMLEDMLRWKKMKQQEKFNSFLTRYYSQLKKLNKLDLEAQNLGETVDWYICDKKGSKKTEVLTGLKLMSYIKDRTFRREFYKIEINGIKQIAIHQIATYVRGKTIETLKLNMKWLCNSIKAYVDETDKYSCDTKIMAHKQLDYLLHSEVEENLEKLLCHFNRSTDPNLHVIANGMTRLDNALKILVTKGNMETNKKIQTQNHKIDQLEMKIIRHLIDTTTTKDVKNEECDNANSINYDKVIKNYTNSDARAVSSKKKSKNSEKPGKVIFTTNAKIIFDQSKEVVKNTKLKLKLADLEKRMERLSQIRNAWLKKHNPNEKNILKYENAFDKILNNKFNSVVRKIEFSEDKIIQKEKATVQMTHLLNDLKLEFIYTNENEHKTKLPEDKYPKSQANSIERCDNCKLNYSNILDCTKYITHSLYEDNLNKFYVLTTTMDQLSFLLHMMRTSIFRDGMSRRNQWSIKKMKKKIVMIRNQLKKILGLNIIIPLLTKCTNANSYKVSLPRCSNVFDSANSYKRVFMDQLKNKDMLNDLNPPTSSYSVSTNSYKPLLTKCSDIFGSANFYNSVFMDQSNNKDILNDLNAPTSSFASGNNNDNDKNDSANSLQ
ncbi:uncharacterized protein LOC116846358 [Odontomachus brunneus]|uniref:uncharacterized protein LOC116846358 n=1 Tax=Odontomachus brunneus TaxID=486640 RepID=UPI0013F228AE|nr:uncharacterized protein LOC116846358 [Odontomachus brunneus]